MTETTDIAPSWNEANIEKALKDARGDLFIAASLMGHVTVTKFLNAVRSSENLRAVYLAIEQIKAHEDFDRISQEQLELEVARRMTVYRADGLEALHALATMPIVKNSAMAQVKLAAASRLAGPAAERGQGAEIEATLRELNEAFHREAPRIKITRTQIEVTPGERVIEGNASPAD